MNPETFIRKWKASTLTERAASQSHFIDLCALLDEPTPTDADPTGEHYAFERGATKTTGGEGWADVWKRGCFAWEYKGRRKDLKAAYAQLQQYAVALENPPLLVVGEPAAPGRLRHGDDRDPQPRPGTTRGTSTQRSQSA